MESIGYLRKHRIATVFIITLLCTAALEAKGRFIDSYAVKVAESVGSLFDSLGGAVNDGIQCMFGCRGDIEKFQRTVIWPPFDCESECSSATDRCNWRLPWPPYKENQE